MAWVDIDPDSAKLSTLKTLAYVNVMSAAARDYRKVLFESVCNDITYHLILLLFLQQSSFKLGW
ncbi:hypothetical protein Hanom_Chr03g00251661 [Helianthus anomalus]